MNWGKGKAYPLLGDKVRIRPERQFPKGPFDDGIWEVHWRDSSEKPPYQLVPWPRDRIKWCSIARRNIRAYERDLVKLDTTELLVCALIEEELRGRDAL